jgi:hypothetical protein
MVDECDQLEVEFPVGLGCVVAAREKESEREVPILDRVVAKRSGERVIQI